MKRKFTKSARVIIAAIVLPFLSLLVPLQGVAATQAEGIPDYIRGMNYESARKMLFAMGWKPLPPTDPMQFGQDADLRMAGFVEFDSCSQGAVQCISYFSNSSGKTLKLNSEGEGDVRNITVVGYAIEDINGVTSGNSTSDHENSNAASTNSDTASAASVKQPEGWGVQYQDGSCVAITNAQSQSPDDPEWEIRMGYISGNQLIFMFSAETTGISKKAFPAKTKAWLTVDGRAFDALNISIQGEAIIVPTENSIELQKQLATAKNVGIRFQLPSSSSPFDIPFDLFNILGAIDWLNSCNVIGAGALPD